MPHLPSYLAGGLLGLLACAAHRPAPLMSELSPSGSSVPAPATERFRLSVAPAAAVGYPMEVEDGRFLPPEGAGSAGMPVAPGFLEGRWGTSSISWGVGDPMQPVPERFWVRWYSYPEDKFYEGHFLLPQQRLTELLRQGYWNTRDKGHETFDEFTLCLLPKGVAVVWLTGANQVLVGRYEGREVDFDFKQFNEAANRPRMVAQEQAKLPPAVQHEIRTRTLSTRRWDAYLKKYPWQIGFSQPVKVINHAIGYFNGEDVNFPLTADLRPYVQDILTASTRPLPKTMLLVVDAGYGRRRKIRVDAFDEAETLTAFQTLHTAAPTLPLTLYVETDERVTQARFFVKNDQQQLPLPHAKLVVYDAD